jgi:hypothetical protein
VNITMARPTLIPFRWDGHGLDIRMHITQRTLLVHGGDVCTALEIEVTEETDERTGKVLRRWPGTPATAGEVGELVDDAGQVVVFYSPTQVRAIATDNPSHLTGGFLGWFDEILAQLDTSRIEAILDDVQRPPSPYASKNYSVARAASILSRDPALQYGQTSLFETMRRALGWIHRHPDGAWRPSDEAVKAGWLFVQPRSIPGPRASYPQVRVTEAGLTELHTRLGGLANLNLDDQTAVPLMEI